MEKDERIDLGAQLQLVSEVRVSRHLLGEGEARGCSSPSQEEMRRAAHEHWGMVEKVLLWGYQEGYFRETRAERAIRMLLGKEKS